MNEFWDWASSIPWYAWIVAVGILVGCVIVILSLRHARASREMLHAERTSAIEAGLPVWEEAESAKHGSKFMHNAFWISFWLVVSVPGAAFSGASAGTKYVDQLAISIAAWSAAALVSIAAVISAVTLMIYARSRQEPRDNN